MKKENLQVLSLVILTLCTFACSKDNNTANNTVSSDTSAQATAILQGPDAFADISDNKQRAKSLFLEMAKVIQHPRCVNCHAAGNRPLQGDQQQPHQPPVFRNNSGMGHPGMLCITCHSATNVQISSTHSIPGHTPWIMPPENQAWENVPISNICEQLKDPERNGNKSIEAVVHHFTEDGLVGWAWNPGAGRSPPPGNQAILGALAQAWMDAGAHCP